MNVEVINVPNGSVVVVFDPECRRDLADAFFTYVMDPDSAKRGQANYKPPLFLTPHPQARTALGMAIPAEFVLHTSGLCEPNKKEVRNILKKRIEQLAAAYPDGLTADEVRSMAVGRFRRELCLDDENHGRGEMDPEQLSSLTDPAEWKCGDGHQKTWPRFVREKMIGLHRSLTGRAFRRLFKDEWEGIRRRMKGLSTLIKQGPEHNPPFNGEEWAAKISNAYPRHDGREIGMRLANGRGKILVIDDSPGEDERLRRRMGKFYDFSQVTLSLKNCSVACWSGMLKKEFTKLDSEAGSLRNYDLVLMDLSLGEGPGEDSGGYHLLPVLRKFFPLLPIFVHSRHQDMTHIERAFRLGATWYLPKRESEKLPAHHVALLDQPHWHREWHLVEASIEWLPQDLNLDDSTKYLVWKAVEHLPGTHIHVDVLRGGMSGSRTYRVSRMIDGCSDLAAPVVVKIDQRAHMMLERERYRRFIAPYLGNHSGRISGPVHAGGGDMGSISYSFAGTSEGREGTSRRIVTLLDLLKRYLPRTYAGVPGKFDEIEGPMNYLLRVILGRIHKIDPDPRKEGSSEVDYPNLVFGEPVPFDAAGDKGSAVEPYLWRMPAKFTLEWNSRTDGEPEEEVRVFRYTGGLNGVIRCLYREKGPNLFQCVKVTGRLGSFVASFRPLRAMQVLKVRGEFVPTAAGEWQDGWVREIKKRECLFEPEVLELLGQENGNLETLADKLVAMVDWLCDPNQPARKALEKGRIGIVHGDTNLRNIIVEIDPNGGLIPVGSDPWLIDFARTCRERVVSDYTQLETALCFELIRPDFFTDDAGNVMWGSFAEFTNIYLETPWEPRVEEWKGRPQLLFVRRLMKLVRDAARDAKVRDERGGGNEEYNASRLWQCLITHKFACRDWKKGGVEGKTDAELRFLAQLTLLQAWLAAKLLGWEP